MHLEIERKFLVKPDGWRARDAGSPVVQGYFDDHGRPARIRISEDRAWVTWKSRPLDAEGRIREEDERPLPVDEARRILETQCERPWIIKRRHREIHDGHTWEIDVFERENEGLILAEIELSRAEEPFVLPPWILREVTGDPRFSNHALSRHPWAR